jgi:hypothetical protein
MNLLKLIGQTFTQLIKEVWMLPQTISNAVKHRQQRTIVDELETERLDRIRHPEKYRGK